MELPPLVTQRQVAEAWLVGSKDRQKRYQHLDAPLRRDEILDILGDPGRVAANPFLPFLRFEQAWQPLRSTGTGKARKKGFTPSRKRKRRAKPRPERKARTIRYAARRDALIFGFYRHMLSVRYEETLARHGIPHCAIAYRRIPNFEGSSRNKSSVDFAADAVRAIRALSNCCAIALDISGFFNNIDHERLLRCWCALLGVERLPSDHFAVFENVTKHASVSLHELQLAVGIKGEIGRTKRGDPIIGYLVPRKGANKQLCPPERFRQLIDRRAGRDRLKVEKNRKPHGIPQGAPISDLLANLYMLEFDIEMAAEANRLGGHYWRYSDDILFVVPLAPTEAASLMANVIGRIGAFGPKMKIKESKCALIEYVKHGAHQRARPIAPPSGPDGLEYLGIRFDGRRVFLRDRTMSGFHRRVTEEARKQAYQMARRYPDKDAITLQGMIVEHKLMAKLGRVRKFDTAAKEDWTFHTYVRRAAAAFGPLGHTILRQNAGSRHHAMERMRRYLVSAVQKRDAVARARSSPPP